MFFSRWIATVRQLFLITAVVTLGAQAAPTQAAPTASAFEQDGSGLVSIEAEHYQAGVASADGHEWLSAGAGLGGYSGTDAMQALPEDKVNRSTDYATRSPRLDYAVNFTQTGTHYVWVRVRAPSTSSNSLHVGLNGQELASAANITVPVKDGYLWVGKVAGGSRTKLNIASKGLHTLNVWMRESGTVIDKVVLTTKATFDPSTVNGGVGPEESASAAATGSTLTSSGTTSSDTGTVSTTSETTTGTTVLSWRAPTTRSNGDPLSLTEIAGYTLHYGAAPGNYTRSISIKDPYTTSITLTDLPLGTYYFAITTHDTGGLKSSYSGAAKRVIQ